MKVVSFCESLLFETPLVRFLAMLTVVAVLRSGVWAMPNLDEARLVALDPFGAPTLSPAFAYLGWTRLGPTVAWALGATGLLAFWLLHAVCAILFMAVVAATALRHLPGEQARVALVLFAVLPVSTTALFWVGQDGPTLLLIALALAVPSRPVAAFAVGVLLGWQHAELAAAAFAALLLALGLDRWRGRDTGRHGPSWALAVLAGVVAGKVLLTVWLVSRDAVPAMNRLDWMRAHLGAGGGDFLLHPHLAPWSVLGLGWLVPLRCLDDIRRWWPFGLALLGLMPLAALVADQTRVLAIATFPLIAVYWLFNPAAAGLLSRRAVALLALAWVVTPYDLAWLANWLTGWPKLPEGLFWWPFL